MPPPSPEPPRVKGAPYHPLQDPYLTVLSPATILVSVHTTPAGRIA